VADKQAKEKAKGPKEKERSEAADQVGEEQHRLFQAAEGDH